MNNICYHFKRICNWRNPRKLGKLAYHYKKSRRLNPYSKDDKTLSWYAWDCGYTTEELNSLLKQCLRTIEGARYEM